MRSSGKKAIRRGKSSKRSRSATVHAIGYEQPSLKDRVAIAEGRRDYKRGHFVPWARTKRQLIESRPGVLAGEPVVKGTRIPARLIADFVRQRVSRATIRREYDLSNEQIEAAVLFDRVTPRRSLTPVRGLHVKKHVPADR
jgi:uncharacterized protein (DUF433 family)